MKNQTISLTRLLLALMVVFLHIKPVSGNDLAFYVLDFGETLCRLAVPCFFVISGYLFFRGFEEKWDWSLYGTKLKKRIKTLLVPYLLWNVLVALYFVFPMFIGAHRPGLNGISGWLMAHGGGVNFLWADPIYASDPIDCPLWFIRNLMVINVFTPPSMSL